MSKLNGLAQMTCSFGRTAIQFMPANFKYMIIGIGEIGVMKTKFKKTIKMLYAIRTTHDFAHLKKILTISKVVQSHYPKFECSLPADDLR